MKMKIAKLFASVSGNYDYRYIVIQYVIQLQTITSLCITNDKNGIETFDFKIKSCKSKQFL